jgi:ribose transport system ATP-binding protein
VEAEVTQAATEPALEIRRLSKTFGGQKALQEVDFSLLPGEVHGLLGQNGSGKSTLIKVLTGFHEPDPGAKLLVFGQTVKLPVPPGEFRRLGLSFVHQTLGLIPSLTVLENLLLPQLAVARAFRVDWAAERAAARATLARYELDIDPSVALSRLSSIERALVAIVRAVEEIGARRGVLVLDEPTPFLPRRDVEHLFAMIRRIAANGSAVMFVSHDIDEVREITDRATVLRDGRLAGTLVTRTASRKAFVRMIIGRDLGPSERRAARTAPRAAAVLSGLSGGQVKDLTVALAPGEVVGITGLLGAGYEQVPYLAYGALPAVGGTLELPNQRLALAGLSPAAALEAGLVLIPGDRPVAGGVGALPIVDNVTLPALSRRFRPWLLRRGAMMRTARELNEAFGVVPNRPELVLSALSGGNQQKVILAKWLQMQPILVLLDEPTQGVDVGARELVFRAIRAAAQKGACILCASSDADQLAEICDRVLVLARGRLAAEITPPALSKNAIVEQCYQAAA